jgi:CheY-like chemotaxis protein
MMSKGTVLAVDDEAIALRILKMTLEGGGYEVVTAASGEAALEELDAAPDRFDAVLLDRIMPGMGGMEVLRSIRTDSRFLGLPVIMQTAASLPCEIQEGFSAGAHYYVTKPYDDQVLLSVTDSATAKYQQFRDVMGWGAESVAALSLMLQGLFRIRTPHEARMVANLVADLAECPAAVMLGMMELLINGIENGNLGFSGEEKDALIREGRWKDELIQRLYDPQNMDKFIYVAFGVEDGVTTVTIKDEGNGFDFERQLNDVADRAFTARGRGIFMARAFSFDSLIYSEGGTRVQVTFPALQQ